jgi:hypothetical protein
MVVTGMMVMIRTTGTKGRNDPSNDNSNSIDESVMKRHGFIFYNGMEFLQTAHFISAFGFDKSGAGHFAHHETRSNTPQFS